MPECVIKYARPRTVDLLDRDLRNAAREALAERLMHVLPHYIVTVLNDIAGTLLKVDELEIDIVPFHPAAYNPADLKVTIATGIQRVWEHRVAIRTALRQRIIDWLESYAQSVKHDLSAIVTLEVNLYLSQMCGETFAVQEGELADQWDDVPAP